jgi:hypothetical protein
MAGCDIDVAAMAPTDNKQITRRFNCMRSLARFFNTPQRTMI